MCCSWWMYLLGSLLAGLFGWLLRGYFAQRKLDDLEASQESANASIRRLTADNIKAKHEYDAKVNRLQQDVKNLEETQRTEKDTIHKKWLEKADNLNTELNTMQEENTALQSSIDELKKIERSDELVPPPDLQRVNEELNYYKEKSLKNKRKYKKLEKKYLKSLKGTEKKPDHSKPQSVVKEVPVEITKRVEVQELVDFKKLKKLLTNKLPTVKKTKVTGITKKKGKPKIVKRKSE